MSDGREHASRFGRETAERQRAVASVRRAALGVSHPPPPSASRSHILHVTRSHPRLGGMLLLDSIVSRTIDAFDYINRHIVEWDRVRRRHIIHWHHPAALLVLPMLVVLFVLALLVVPFVRAWMPRHR